MRFIGIDFEFFNSNEAIMTPVAAVICFPDMTMKFDLLSKLETLGFHGFMYCIKESKDILIAHAAGAEARALISLGIEPLDFLWIDTYVEFIMLCNSNNKYRHGNYLNKQGDICFSTPKKPGLSLEEILSDFEDHTESPKNLVNCAYKLIKERLDQEEKDTMRDLILSRDISMIQENMQAILDYCESDTRHLVSIYEAICLALTAEGLSDFLPDQLERGRYAVASAKCESLGIPINITLLNRLIEKTPNILEQQKEMVNEYFPCFTKEYQKPPKVVGVRCRSHSHIQIQTSYTVWISIEQIKGLYYYGFISNLKKRRKALPRSKGDCKIVHYKPIPPKKDSKAYQNYVGSLNIPIFPCTATGRYKSDSDTLEEWRSAKGIDALFKYNKTEASLNWFNKDNKNGFFDRFSTKDNCVRPYYGIFGTQTGRNAAKAKTFPLAMSSWLRAIIQPKKNQYIIGSDFSQQEVYVAGILSGDQNLLSAYNSGDVYLAFAKQAAMVPQEATKYSHKNERLLCKSTVLGLQFGMGKAKLQTKLTLDSGHPVSEQQTQDLIDAHKTTYSQYWKWVKEISLEYKSGTPLITSDGWALFCDNQVMTSVRNFPVQATAAAITRKAIIRCWEMGLQVMCGLHDAVYVISDHPEFDKDILEEVMLWATEQILKESKTTMRIDTKILSHEDIWVDEKGQEDWNKLKEFLL